MTSQPSISDEDLDLLRDEQLSAYAVLDQPADPDLQALVDLAAQVCDVPNAVINLISSTHQHQVAAHGFDASVCSREDSMCAAVLGDADTIMVPDASEDARFRANPFVTGEIGDVRFYASAPLVSRIGVTIGRLCVFDDVPRKITAEHLRTLWVLAERIVDILELRLRTRQLEESLAALTRTQEELHRSNEKLAVFADQVSHDLRSPLTAVLANAELLATEPAISRDEELLQLVSGTLTAGRRMAAMIQDILDFARLGAALKLAETELGELVGHVCRDLQPALRSSGGTVNVGVMPTLRVDEQQVYSVLLNLVSNAVKFTRNGTAPEVEIAAARTEVGWRITVSDNGPGIPEHERRRAFELFARGVSEVDGMGIGLASARRIVEAHGGSIGIDDSPAGGAAVWFEIPD